MTPEQQARQKIDDLLKAAGWIIQNKDAIEYFVARGVAVCEFSPPNGRRIL